MHEPNFLSIVEAQHAFEAGTLSAQALRAACAAQIARLNPQLNAFITVLEPEVEHAPARAGRLAGIPLALKDLFETKGIRTTAGSAFFKDYVPAQNAVVTQKLEDEGALILGKTNLHEIALGVTNNNPHFGACRNPWDPARIPGGSSGGSAVAVVSGMALAALGTDTGGSIRIPAALCGIVGLKPTFGRVSLRGVFPLSWNLDHVGPMTRTAADAALLLQVIAGFDAEDPASVDTPVKDYQAYLGDTLRGQTFALATGSYIDEADTDVLEALQAAAGVFAALGAKIEACNLDFLREAALANRAMTQADAAAYHRQRLAEHPDWFGTDVRQRLETGRGLSATDYVLARRTQSEMRQRLIGLFDEYDVLLLPTTPSAAPLIEGANAIEQAGRLTRFTAPFNLTGLPAISIPCGFSAAGLPLGLQLVAGPWEEAGLLAAAHAYEQETQWGARRPPITAP